MQTVVRRAAPGRPSAHAVCQPQRPPGGVRRNGPADVARVRFVKAAQRIGFNLDEAAQLLQLEDGTRCTQRLLDVCQRLADLHRIETA